MNVFIKQNEVFMQKKDELCDNEIIHEEIVTKVKKTFPEDEMIFDLADFYKIFGDTTRVKILYALDKSELCVCDISALLGMSVSAVSHQLKILRDSNLVKTKRDGKIVYYSLSDEHVKSILECGIEHISEYEKNTSVFFFQLQFCRWQKLLIRCVHAALLTQSFRR